MSAMKTKVMTDKEQMSRLQKVNRVLNSRPAASCSMTKNSNLIPKKKKNASLLTR